MATPLSSRKTRRVGSSVGAVVAHCARAAATSGRSCSDARTGFFYGTAQLCHGPPNRRQTGGRTQGDLEVGEGAVRLLADQGRERVQLGREHRMPPVTLLARGDFAGFPPPVFEPPDPGGTDAVFARDRGRLHARVASWLSWSTRSRRSIE